jgi:hypothetical protein
VSKDIATLHKLYLKQINFQQEESFNEVLPLSFNYQDMIIVETGIIDCGLFKLVYQTHDCGCGPQPTIRGAVLDLKTDWSLSRTRDHLLSSVEPRDFELADQQIVKTVYQVREPFDGQEKKLMLTSLQKHFGKMAKIKFF